MKKLLVLAAFAATLGLNVAPVMAQGHDGLQSLPLSVTGLQSVERKSGRCPGGEIRFFVPGCSGV